MIQLVLMGKNSKTQISSGIASFTLDKEMYTPYSQLTAAAYGSFSLTQFADVSRVQLLVNGTEMHFGTVEQCRLTLEKGIARVQISSRGLTAMLLQNQLEPGPPCPWTG